MTSLAEIVNLKKNFVTRVVGDELIIVPLTGNVAQMNALFTLNETGKFIWENIHDAQTFDNLLNSLVSEFDIDSESAQRDLNAFLDKLGSTLKK
ncbi:MAG: hypothetical protein H6Q20_971 [Bacteroidetes bacterium]|nr:hypothetical protein [Bacteroidota bacterium]